MAPRKTWWLRRVGSDVLRFQGPVVVLGGGPVEGLFGLAQVLFVMFPALRSSWGLPGRTQTGLAPHRCCSCMGSRQVLFDWGEGKLPGSRLRSGVIDSRHPSDLETV